LSKLAKKYWMFVRYTTPKGTQIDLSSEEPPVGHEEEAYEILRKAADDLMKLGK
jgi:hypothetical protein